VEPRRGPAPVIWGFAGRQSASSGRSSQPSSRSGLTPSAFRLAPAFGVSPRHLRDLLSRADPIPAGANRSGLAATKREPLFPECRQSDRDRIRHRLAKATRRNREGGSCSGMVRRNHGVPRRPHPPYRRGRFCPSRRPHGQSARGRFRTRCGGFLDRRDIGDFGNGSPDLQYGRFLAHGDRLP